MCAPACTQSPTREDILSFLAGKIAKWWMPDDVVFVKEIPHTATGKISKLTLRKQFCAKTRARL
jgi:fatty-acyl-CoA synthase